MKSFLSMNISKELNIEYKNYILFFPRYYEENMRYQKIWLTIIFHWSF